MVRTCPSLAMAGSLLSLCHSGEFYVVQERERKDDIHVKRAVDADDELGIFFALDYPILAEMGAIVGQPHRPPYINVLPFLAAPQIFCLSGRQICATVHVHPPIG